MKLFIKNMVCDRCKMAVRSELTHVGLSPVRVELGEIEIEETETDGKIDALEQRLLALGFELLLDPKARLVEQIKAAIILLVRRDTADAPPNISTYLADYLNKDYASLSNTFSQIEHTTIEKYLILQKVERVKELLTYGEFNINEIAYQLHYSSVAHLSNQFKKITGLSPSAYKKSAENFRRQLDML